MNKYLILIRDAIRGTLLCSIETHEQEDIDWLELDEIVDDALLNPEWVKKLYEGYDTLKITCAKVLKEERLHYNILKETCDSEYHKELLDEYLRITNEMKPKFSIHAIIKCEKCHTYIFM